MSRPRPALSRAPLVVDTRELGRRPGAMVRFRLAAPTPGRLRVELAGVPDDAVLDVDLRLEAVMEGVLATGTVHVPVVAECSRCLDPLRQVLDAEFQQLYVYPDADQPSDDELGVIDNEQIDLEWAIRDAVVLALPLAPRCREDCPGLCAACGVRLADDPTHQHAGSDSRWATLAAWQPSARDNGSNRSAKES